MYLPKVTSRKNCVEKLFFAGILEVSFLLASWRSMAKIAGSGSISHRHGSADPDVHQNVMAPEQWFSGRRNFGSITNKLSEVKYKRLDKLDIGIY
jgi:hypothetical protein